MDGRDKPGHDPRIKSGAGYGNHPKETSQQLLQLGGKGLGEVGAVERVGHVGEQETELRAAVEASALVAEGIKGLRLGAEVR